MTLASRNRTIYRLTGYIARIIERYTAVRTSTVAYFIRIFETRLEKSGFDENYVCFRRRRSNNGDCLLRMHFDKQNVRVSFNKNRPRVTQSTEQTINMYVRVCI